MAKEKKKPMDEPMAVVDEEIIEEVAVEQPKHEDFVSRTLKAINKMENHAKAERLANRLLRKRR